MTCFRPESNRGPYGLLTFLSAALSTTELWWRMNHRKSFRTLNQNWVVNPEWKRQNPGSGWERNHADSKKGGGGVNVRDKTCSKDWDTGKNKNQTSLGISLPLESGQLERWYFHLGASNGISGSEKSDKCVVTHPNLRREPGEKFG